MPTLHPILKITLVIAAATTAFASAWHLGPAGTQQRVLHQCQVHAQLLNAHLAHNPRIANPHVTINTNGTLTVHASAASPQIATEIRTLVTSTHPPVPVHLQILIPYDDHQTMTANLTPIFP